MSESRCSFLSVCGFISSSLHMDVYTHNLCLHYVGLGT